MSSTTEAAVQPTNFDRTVAGLKKGVQSAAAVQAQASEQVIRTSKEVAVFGQGTVEAFVQAAQIYARGSQDLFRQARETSQAAVVETLNGLRAIATAKTPKEQIELQANFVRSSAIWAVREYSRFAQAGIELAEQVSAPLVARAVVAAESLSPKA